MTSIGSPSPFFFGGKKAYAVDRSLRFNDGDNTYLNRTPSSASNRRTWTWSGWIKRCTFGAVHDLFSAYDGSAYNIIRIGNNDQLNFQSNTAAIKLTNAKLRDPSAWYHIVVSVDTTNSTAADRVIIYINGARQTLATDNSVSENTDYAFNTTNAHTLGVYANGSSYDFDGYMAEINFIDGLQYDPSYFGETDLITGQWNPKKYVGSYGTNGYYLNFSDNSGTTATTLGKDSSGNGNNFTPNNFSVSAGVGNDSVTDTPTNNFATLNPLSLTGAGGTFSNGNLDFTADSNYATRTGNISLKTGKWYWEITITNIGTDLHGIVQGTHPNGNTYPGYDTNGNVKGIGWFSGSGGLLYGAVPDGATNGATIGAGNTALSAYTTNDVLGFASDIANGTLAFYKNGTLEYTLTGIGSHDWFPAVCGYGTSSTKTINFGQLKATSTTYADANGHGNFKYSVPSGFLAMCTANLPDPTIKLPNKHFDTVLYTGDGNATGSQTDVLQFQPDWLWSKPRTAAYVHLLYDSLRGAGSGKALNLGGGTSPGAGVEGAAADNATYGYLNSFDASGFSYTRGSATTTYFNQSGINYVVWNWNAGDTNGKTYAVTVVSDSGNKYRFDGFGTSAVTLDLAEGGTYVFDWSDSSAQSHPIRFSTTSDGTHGGGSEYTTGVTKDDSAYKTTITVAASAPTLYYYCQNHSGMGGQINTNSTLGSSNFDGSTQTTVKVNATAGFSIVTYEGNGTDGATIGHGLGVTPSHVIWKNRDAAVNWINWQTQLADTCVLLNNSIYAISASGNALFTYGDFNSTQLKLKTGTHTNGNNNSIVAYCFSEVEGYSKFGSYKGNGSTDGTFVFTGFRPAVIILKRTNASASWVIHDDKRAGYNGDNDYLHPDLLQAESDGSTGTLDILSNGFKLRMTAGTHNGSGDTFIYLAFAESPFKYARAR
tara:strand:- start:62 stop:2869 length:2808 start_codon:yes stop_codon:yes gene_type:complete